MKGGFGKSLYSGQNSVALLSEMLKFFRPTFFFFLNTSKAHANLRETFAALRQTSLIQRETMSGCEPRMKSENSSVQKPVLVQKFFQPLS